MGIKKKILVVDDDPEMTFLIKEILKKDYRISITHNGPEAFEKTRGENFDLILTDIRMPYLSGIWFCDAFKNKPETKHIPVIMISGLPPEENMGKAYRVGASAYLKKPFRPNELRAIVKKVL